MGMTYDCVNFKKQTRKTFYILLFMVLFLTLVTGYLYVKNAQLERKVESQIQKININ